MANLQDFATFEHLRSLILLLFLNVLSQTVGSLSIHYNGDLWW